MKLSTILHEILDSNQPQSDTTFQMYHGGKRWTRLPTELLGSGKGRYEAGVGIYLTNNYDTARRYAKGSRVVHLVNIDKNFKNLKDVRVPVDELVEFVKSVPGLRKKSEIITDIKSYADRVKRVDVSADVLNNLVVNYEVGSGGAGIAISNFFVSKGADAHVENRSGDEYWIVIFNPKIIKSVSVVDPSKIGKEFKFMLPQIATR